MPPNFDWLFAPTTTNDERKALERFVALRLEEAGVWPSSRASNGIVSYRTLERGPTP